MPTVKKDIHTDNSVNTAQSNRENQVLTRNYSFPILVVLTIIQEARNDYRHYWRREQPRGRNRQNN